MNANAYTVRNRDFTEPIVVVCPKCGEQATVVGARGDAPVATYEAQVRFTCAACAYTVEYANTPKFAPRGRALLLNTACDPFFGFRLWYIIETPYGTLWAYNLAHLQVIEHYMATPDDERDDPDGLPAWVKDAKHRVLLLKLIQQLKA